MSKDDKESAKEGTGLPEDDVKSRRELLAATAKLSAFISAIGLTGMGLSEAAEAAQTEKTGVRMHKVRPRMQKGLLPAVQKREAKLLLRDAMRMGDSKAALKRHPDLKLSPSQRTALMRMTKQDWAALRRLQVKLRPLEGLADDTGNIIY